MFYLQCPGIFNITHRGINGNPNNFPMEQKERLFLKGNLFNLI